MQSAFLSGASASPPTMPTSPSLGYPVPGNPGVSLATKPGAWWYHMMTQEVCNVLLAAGIAPDQANLAQLLAAMRSGGVFCPVLQLNSTQVLPTTAFGSTVQAYGTGPFTLTLPPTAGILPRTKIEFGNYCGSGLVTIASSSANMSWNGVVASVASFNLGLGDTATLMWTGASWLVISGSARLSFSSGFKASLGGSGYQKLPSGLILQWMSGTAGASGASANNIYPVAFPTQVCFACGIHLGTDATVNVTVDGSNITSTQVGMRSSYASSVACLIFAVGF